MTARDLVWGYEGRISRKDYWLTWFIYTVGFVALNYAIQPLWRGREREVLFFTNVFFLFFFQFPTVKRYHDVGCPGWYVFLALIPIANFYFGFYLLFFKRGKSP
jgi:uncharacterized membrane protein YhaH (DUF805 family)